MKTTDITSPSCCLLCPSWKKYPSITFLFSFFSRKNERLFIVGGAVRDALMGYGGGDIDFATTATPQRMEEMARQEGITTKSIGADHGTILFILEKQAYQITTFREDIATDGRHATVQFGTNMLQDAQRRDFTINALYADEEGHIYAPLPDSLPDIQQKRVRFIGTPVQRIHEDYLRILRYYRFALSYDKSIHSDLESLFSTVTARLSMLSLERIFQELKMILAHPKWHMAAASLQCLNFFNTLFPKHHKEIILKLIQQKSPPLSWESWLWLLSPEEAPLSRQQKALVSLLKKVPQPLAQMPTDYKIWRHYLPFHLMEDLAVIYNLSDFSTPLPTSWKKYVYERQDKKFPLTGADLLAAGMMPGPKISHILKETLHWWLKKDGIASREDCLQYGLNLQ